MVRFLLLSFNRGNAALRLALTHMAIQNEETTEPVSSSTSRQLLTLVRPVMEDMHQFIEGSACVVVFMDDEARIVDCFGDADMQRGTGPSRFACRRVVE